MIDFSEINLSQIRISFLIRSGYFEFAKRSFSSCRHFSAVTQEFLEWMKNISRFCRSRRFGFIAVPISSKITLIEVLSEMERCWIMNSSKSGPAILKRCDCWMLMTVFSLKKSEASAYLWNSLCHLTERIELRWSFCFKRHLQLSKINNPSCCFMFFRNFLTVLENVILFIEFYKLVG